MFDFLMATGKFGVIGVCLVFLVVFILAEPGTEISFWGIKFHKKYKFFKSFNWKKIPKKIPKNWETVLHAFGNLDDDHAHERLVFEQTRNLAGLSELETKHVFTEMEAYNLIGYWSGYVTLKPKALPLANMIKQKIND